MKRKITKDEKYPTERNKTGDAVDPDKEDTSELHRFNEAAARREALELCNEISNKQIKLQFSDMDLPPYI